MKSLSMSYYNENFRDFINSTVNVDMTGLYEPFLALLSKGASILDLGCGSGRDLKYFVEQGYVGVGLEPSSQLAAFARVHSKSEVIEHTIEEYQPKRVFDGVWACASLLHLTTPGLIEALLTIGKMTHADSCCYCSFKYGDFEGQRSGRFFNDQTEKSLKELLPTTLRVQKHWVTNDKRPGRENENWLNALIKKNV